MQPKQRMKRFQSKCSSNSSNSAGVCLAGERQSGGEGEREGDGERVREREKRRGDWLGNIPQRLFMKVQCYAQDEQ